MRAIRSRMRSWLRDSIGPELPTWPGDAKFAFAIFDDTDNATVANTKPVYDYLNLRGAVATKSVWVFDSRGKYAGESLQNTDYLKWIKELQENGCEIALHGVGDGPFEREEIIDGIEVYRQKVGGYPRLHCNHSNNPDNLYWWGKRFCWPISIAYRLAKLFARKRSQALGGDCSESPHFWGDVAREKISYVRNFTFRGPNTLAVDYLMPWHDSKKPYVNKWFSSSDGGNVAKFNALLSSSNLDLLERTQGACIVYTHFASGFVSQDGGLDTDFKSRVDDLTRRDVWITTCGELLEYLDSKPRKPPSLGYLLRLNGFWLFEKVKDFLGARLCR